MFPKKIKRAVLTAGLALFCLYLVSLFYDHVAIRWFEAIYDGRSAGFLNRIFTNHQNHPFNYYSAKCRAYLLYETAFILLAIYFWVVAELSLKKAGQTVRGFFEVKTHPVNLAVFRIAFFLTMIFLTDIRKTIWFSGFPAQLRMPPTGAAWLLHFLPADPTFASAVCSVFLFFCFTGLFGLFSRTSALVVCLSGLYVLGMPQFYGKVNHYHHLIWFSALLSAGPCGDALSIDALIGAWRQTSRGYFKPAGPSSAYTAPLRFVWILFGVLYFFPGFWKLATGPAWTLGDNFKYMIYSEWVELKGWTPFFRIDRYHLLCSASALSAIFFEMSFVFLIFSDRFRPLAVWSGIAFHNVTDLLMKISFIELQVLYVVFFDWHSIFSRAGEFLFKERMFVLFDGNCRICRGTIGSLRVLDVLGRVTYVNSLSPQEIEENGLGWLPTQALLEDMHAVAGKRVWKGFESYRALAARILFFWPVLPFLWLWPMPWAGRRVYRLVADSRRCAVTDNKIQDTSSSHRGGLRPAFTVGVLLLAANIIFGFGKIEAAWPFACYPTFGYLWGPEKPGLAIEVSTSDGKTIAVNLDKLLDKFSSERFWGLVGRILAIKDENEKRLRLAAFWKICGENDPELRNVSVVRFYKEVLTTIPERRHENPLSRELLYEMPVLS